MPIRGKGNKRTREKEANENDLSVQRRKIFEQLEEMEKQLLTRKVEMAKTPEKENILFKKRKDIKITKTSAIERIGNEAVID